MTVVWVALGLAGLVVVAAAVLYSGFARGQTTVAAAWSAIDAQLRRRHDLVPDLVGLVRQYASHERSLFEEAGEARVRTMGIAGDVAAKAKAESLLSDTLRSLLAVAEASPERTADARFLCLRQDLDAVEDAIQRACRAYNEAVRAQNDRRHRFPGSLVASVFHFGPVVPFDLDNPVGKSVPDVTAFFG